MKLIIENKRKDGRYTVVYCFENGVRIKKILTEEKLRQEEEKNVQG
jgi:hypothetical protein